ncbi:MAG: DUF3795 domain-containing protein [Candidatus Heimdallarchaeaceae archaeon]
MKNGIAVCGLKCSSCDIYLVDKNESKAENILGWFKKEGWRPETLTVQEFMEEGALCEGCRTDPTIGKHWSANCDLRSCCIEEKQLNSCHQCDEFVCDQLDLWSKENKVYTKALDKLMQLKEQDL